MHGLVSAAVRFFLLLSAAALAGPMAAATDKRVALVIGNSTYRHTATLANPQNDGVLVADFLRKNRFEVIEASNLDEVAMRAAIRQFATRLRGSDVGLLYYAGHGLQVGGQNYLVPVDAKLDTTEALDFELVRLDTLQRLMEQSTKTNLIFLDACRDNPLSRNLARAMGSSSRSQPPQRGLAPVESGSGTLISFSTQPGNVALDGDGRHSPYAKSLVTRAGETGDDLSAVLIRVRNDVMAATGDRQVPWEHSALRARFYFQPPPAVAPAPAAPTYRQQAELAYWETVKTSRDPAILESYLAQFPQGIFVPLAKRLVEGLKAEQERDRISRQREEELQDAQAAREAAAARERESQRQLLEVRRTEELQRAQQEARKAHQDLQVAEQRRKQAETVAEDARKAAALARAESEAAQRAAQRSEGELRVAAVGPAAAPVVAPAAPSIASPPADRAGLVRALQQELTRAGCNPGPIDGQWGEQGRRAARKFTGLQQSRIDTDEPTQALLEALRATTGRVCPVACEEGEKLVGGACVANAPATRAVAPKRVSGALSQEPAAGQLRSGQRVLVDDGSCPPGMIKELTGGSNRVLGTDTARGGGRRERRCIPR
jgi:uncharacterized caspase-like protein